MTSIDFKALLKQAKDNKSTFNDVVVPRRSTDWRWSENDELANTDSVKKKEPDDFRRFDEAFKSMRMGPLRDVYYIPDFIDPSEEDLLWDKIYEQPPDRWTQLRRRKVQCWDAMVEPFPEWLRDLTELFSVGEKVHPFGAVFAERPNHVLINEYVGAEGIFAHKDGPAYYPRIAILSLKGSTLIEFRESLRPTESEDPVQFILQPRSLLIFVRDAFYKFYHEIPEIYTYRVGPHVANKDIVGIPEGTECIRSHRVSITLRILLTKK